MSRGTLVRADFLRLIDEDRLAELPSGAYAKGFIRSYATFVGLDSRPFVQAYEERYAQPEPELSTVVQRGMRVPPDLHRRAWKVAVGSAALILVTLGMLGVFRSDGHPQGLPEVNVSAARNVTAPAPNPMGAVVQVMVADEESWVQAEADGQSIFGQILKPGETKTFKGSREVVLYVARAREVRIIANGVDLGVPDVPSFRGVFTPTTTALPEATVIEDLTPDAPELPAGALEEPEPPHDVEVREP